MWEMSLVWRVVIPQLCVTNKMGCYLAYALATNDAQRQKSRGKKKSKVVHASIPDLKKVKIPLPPLPVQNVIANALDAMDAVVKALEEERNARFEQFEAMRDKLLKFANGGFVR